MMVCCYLPTVGQSSSRSIVLEAFVLCTLWARPNQSIVEKVLLKVSLACLRLPTRSRARSAPFLFSLPPKPPSPCSHVLLYFMTISYPAAMSKYSLKNHHHSEFLEGYIQAMYVASTSWT